MKKTILSIGVTLLLVATTFAQTYVTNLVYKGHRQVDGKIYFPAKSELWEQVSGSCVKIEADGIIIKVTTTETEVISEPLYQALPGRYDAFGNRSNPRRMLVQEGQTKQHTTTRKLFINNYRAKTAVGAKVTVTAMKTGSSGSVELWDCGTPVSVPMVSKLNKKLNQVSTNSPATQP